MATLSSFFGSSGGGGAAGVASTLRVFHETGSITVPSCAVFAVYGVIGGGGLGNVGTGFDSNSCYCSGGGGGFAYKETAQSCASNFTVCAIVGNRACTCLCCCQQIWVEQAGSSCICGFSGGTICATGACGRCPGSGTGGDINNSGGWGGAIENKLGGGGAGGLNGQGGAARASSGGGGFGSGGGGGAHCGQAESNIKFNCCQLCKFTEGPAMGGGGGGDGGRFVGGSGLSGQGGSAGIAASQTGYGVGNALPPTGGLVPMYTMCGYSQAKTFLSASGGGGGSGGAGGINSITGQSGAPGGGGGHGYTSGGSGGFGAGAGASHCTHKSGSGHAGIGGGGAGTTESGESRSSLPGTGIAMVEYWVTTS